MDLTALVGLIALAAALVFGIVFGDDGINMAMLMNFFNGPSLFIVIGGTFFALLVAFPLKYFTLFPKHMKMILSKEKKDPFAYVETITELSREARKKGLLALEDMAMAFDDEFLKESVLLIVDAIEPDKLKNWFNQKLEYMAKRDEEERKIYLQGAALAPAFGMIGTLIGLVNMLKSMNLDEGPGTLGADMSVALITTFYGSVLANGLFVPLANKLEIVQEKEMLLKEMIIEGVISIKEGENPKFIQEKLLNFLDQKNLNGKSKGSDSDTGEEPAKKPGKRLGRKSA
ncbi:MAG: MotA/TolQ/ExbB proton channel family protein [Eubacteriales bacterium]|nr:MotA/TolQ/ExbB proton channel family protein [Eubacteriales bacterium]